MTDEQPTEEPTRITVATELDPISGVYYPVVQFGPDVIRPLNRQEARDYVTGLAVTLAYAEYDAAVLAQMSDVMSGDLQAAGYMVAELRANRPEVDRAATAPFVFLPIVSHRTRKPMVSVVLNGTELGMWAPDDVQHHMLAILSGPIHADLDQHYARCLVGQMGIEEPRARNVVMDLGNYFTGAEHS